MGALIGVLFCAYSTVVRAEVEARFRADNHTQLPALAARTAAC